MIQILLHLIGDYLFQNDWMAVNKAQKSERGYIACMVHCMAYTLPFALYYQSLPAASIIFGTHFLIDKYRLPIYWIKLVNWNWSSGNYGYSDAKPVWMSTWLFIIVDNIFHLICNYIAITYFL